MYSFEGIRDRKSEIRGISVLIFPVFGKKIIYWLEFSAFEGIALPELAFKTLFITNI